MSARLTISAPICAQILREAEQAHPFEACGLIFGTPSADGTVYHVHHIQPASNIAPDPHRHFEIDPHVLFAAHRAVRDGGVPILGCYHSHPNGSCVPSSLDAHMAIASWVWLIVGGGEMAAYMAAETGPVAGVFHPLHIADHIGDDA